MRRGSVEHKLLSSLTPWGRKEKEQYAKESKTEECRYIASSRRQGDK